jgi:hypothetical protein
MAEQTSAQRSGPTPKGGKRNQYHTPTKNEMKQSLDEIDAGFSAEDIKKKYKTSKGSAEKIFRILRNRAYYEVTDNTPTPKGYMAPKSVEEVVDAALFDRGLVKVQE